MPISEYRIGNTASFGNIEKIYDDIKRKESGRCFSCLPKKKLIRIQIGDDGKNI